MLITMMDATVGLGVIKYINSKNSNLPQMVGYTTGKNKAECFCCCSFYFLWRKKKTWEIQLPTKLYHVSNSSMHSPKKLVKFVESTVPITEKSSIRKSIHQFMHKTDKKKKKTDHQE
jgi:hypothetical protein